MNREFKATYTFGHGSRVLTTLRELDIIKIGLHKAINNKARSLDLPELFHCHVNLPGDIQKESHNHNNPLS